MRREGRPGSKPVAHSQALCGSLLPEAAPLPSVASVAGLQRAFRKHKA